MCGEAEEGLFSAKHICGIIQFADKLDNYKKFHDLRWAYVNDIDFGLAESRRRKGSCTFQMKSSSLALGPQEQHQKIVSP